MKVFERYFQRNVIKYRPDFPVGIGLMVVIPVLEDPDILETISSLCDCELPQQSVGVLIVVNNAEGVDSTKNRTLAGAIRTVIKEKNDLSFAMDANHRLHFELIEAYDLPLKFAGVGLARKIGMDVATDYFYCVGNFDGVIVSLDADTNVERNYFVALECCFRDSPVAAVSIAYAHRLSGITSCLENAIVGYELYLRYYREALKYVGHPHYYHCIGSAFAVRVSDYVAQGGMNRRQAGEDFYFLQKLVATGRFWDLVTTHVYPSPRLSARTPFGTGQAVRQIMESGGDLLTYDFEAFQVLRVFFQGVEGLYKADMERCFCYLREQHVGLIAFLSESDFKDVMSDVNGNCASLKQFNRRFFDHFNAFRVLKYLNFVHDGYFEKQKIEITVAGLQAALGTLPGKNRGEQLLFLRSLQDSR